MNPVGCVIWKADSVAPNVSKSTLAPISYCRARAGGKAWLVLTAVFGAVSAVSPSMRLA